MHANCHRKDAVILQEGFQRFKMADECGNPKCQFNNMRTTHFHCLRPGCNYSFKNKADMGKLKLVQRRVFINQINELMFFIFLEKHKNHHQKNDEIAKDGFKKFTKYESCNFANCKSSLVVNHIHCIRPGKGVSCISVVYNC